MSIKIIIIFRAHDGCDSIKLNRKRSKGSGVRGFRGCTATCYGDYDKRLCISSFEDATIGRALLRKSLQNKPEP